MHEEDTAIGGFGVSRKNISVWIGLSCILFFIAIAGGIVYLDNQDTIGTVQLISNAADDTETLNDIQQASDAFNDLIAMDMDTHLHHDIKMFVAFSPKDYQKILKQNFHLSQAEAEHIAVVTGGWSNGNTHKSVLNVSSNVMTSSSMRSSITGHELFHQLQTELSHKHNTNEQSLFWMDEGTADYVGAVIAEKLGYETLQQWQNNRIMSMRCLPHNVSASELQICNNEKRTELLSENKSSYQMADLMVIYLLSQQSAEERLSKIAEYFRQLGTTKDSETAFQQTFHISLNDFITKYNAWFTKTMQETANINVYRQGNVTPDMAMETENNIHFSKDFMMQQCSLDFHGSYDLYLTDSNESFAQILHQKLCIDDKESQEKAKKHIWIRKGNVLVLNLATLDSPAKRKFVIAALLADITQSQQSASMSSQLEWLDCGSVYVVAAYAMMNNGYIDRYQRAWLADLRRTDQNIPDLVNLKTEPSWAEAEQAYDNQTVVATSELAAAYLVEKYGLRTFHNWYLAVRQQEDAAKAFKQVYHITPDEFAKDFKIYLQYHL